MLLKDLKQLAEQALESKTAEDLWDENKDSSASYVSAQTYLVRPIKGTSPTKFEVMVVNGDQSKPYGKFDSKELNDTLKPIRPNQTPDAEGYTTYVDATEVEAFKYTGDPIKVELSDEETVQLNNGDFVVRSVKGNNFTYTIEKATDFEATLKKA